MGRGPKSKVFLPRIIFYIFTDQRIIRHNNARLLGILELFSKTSLILLAVSPENALWIAPPIGSFSAGGECEQNLMAQLIQLETGIFVAAQLVEPDFAEVAARGFRSVVNNRPDGEAPDQLPNVRAKAAALRYRLQYRYQPVENLNVTDEDVVNAHARLMNDLPGPILFYCRSGTRCTILWAQVAVLRLGVAKTLEITSGAGYDLEILREHLTERSCLNGTALRKTVTNRGAALKPLSSSRPF
jgi:sulfide:quinone oxidoreductase